MGIAQDVSAGNKLAAVPVTDCPSHRGKIDKEGYDSGYNCEHSIQPVKIADFFPDRLVQSSLLKKGGLGVDIYYTENINAGSIIRPTNIYVHRRYTSFFDSLIRPLVRPMEVI